MKKLLFILTLFIAFTTKSQTLNWAKQIGNNNYKLFYQFNSF